MTDNAADWETLYRWEWFRRAQWRPTFREQKRGTFGGSCEAFRRIVAELGGGPVLDCSCGFGLKTIVMKEMGLDVTGSDRCASAVVKARELARLEGHDDIDYLVSTWSELPERTDRRFIAVFNDALSWTLTRNAFEASLRGFLGALRPGGALVFMGAPEGSPADPKQRRKLLLDTFASQPKFRIEWTHEDAGTRCTALAFRELGDDFFDEHHVYVIEEAGNQRIETATIRQPVTWDWPVLVEMFDKAGFASLHTRTFEGLGHGGKTIQLNVAVR